MRRLARILTSMLALTALRAQAAADGFEGGLSGIFFGLGSTYLTPLTFENRWDPIPQWLGIDVTGSKSVMFLPMKVGFFHSPAERIEVQAYGRYILTMPMAWTTALGEGETSFRSFGFGGNIHFFVLDGHRIRVGLSANAELVYQRALFSFYPADGSTQSFNATATARLVGVGLVGQLWLGDLWSIEGTALYQHGAEGSWTLVDEGEFANTTKTSGILKDPNGGTIIAEFGGFFAEVALRLVF